MTAACTRATDSDAIDWPLVVHPCSECNLQTATHCGYCGEPLCNAINCIQDHSERGCKWE